MAYTDYFGTVQKLYIGYYQRPADPGGLLYWAEWMDRNPGEIPNISPPIIPIEPFANSAESTALYGTIDSANISTVVDSIYNALFGCSAETAGKAYYVNGFNAGTFTAATIMLNILDGAQNEDLLSVDNKVIAANLFTMVIDPGLDGRDYQFSYDGDADAQKGREFLSEVTCDPATIPTYAETIEYVMDNWNWIPPDPSEQFYHELSGKTFTLTTGVDNIVSTTFYDLKADSINAFILTGDGNIKFTTLTSGDTLALTSDTSIKFTTLTDGAKIDASGSTGDITLDASAFNTAPVAYVGSSGIDTYKATEGSSIKGNEGNDQIILIPPGPVFALHGKTFVLNGENPDIIIYTSGSDVSFKDADSDGKIDSCSIETITNFATYRSCGGWGAMDPTTGEIIYPDTINSDKIDLSSFGFSDMDNLSSLIGSVKGVKIKGTLACSVESGSFPFTIAEFFKEGFIYIIDDPDTNVVSWGSGFVNVGAAYGTNGGDTYVFVDADKDGNFDALKDIAIKLVGVTDFYQADIDFG